MCAGVMDNQSDENSTLRECRKESKTFIEVFEIGKTEPIYMGILRTAFDYTPLCEDETECIDLCKKVKHLRRCVESATHECCYRNMYTTLSEADQALNLDSRNYGTSQCVVKAVMIERYGYKLTQPHLEFVLKKKAK